MLGAVVEVQRTHRVAAERAARDHALDSFFKHTFRETALEHLARGDALDAARITGVLVINFLVQLAAGEANLVRVDDDDMVAAIDVRCIDRLVLAAQDIGDNRRDAADNQPVRIDQMPLLLDLMRLGRLGRLHQRLHGVCLFSKTGKRHQAGAAVGVANGSRGGNRQANPAVCERVK